MCTGTDAATADQTSLADAMRQAERDKRSLHGGEAGVNAGRYATVDGFVGPNIERLIEFKIDRLLTEIQDLQRLRNVVRGMFGDHVPSEIGEVLRAHLNRN